MVLAREVTAEYCHINPVRSDASLGATEMPEQKRTQIQQQNLSARSTGMSCLFCGLAEVKTQEKSFLEFGGETRNSRHDLER